MADKSVLIRMLARRDKLSTEDIELINLLPTREVSFPSGAEIVAEGSRPKESCLVLSGFAARSQSLSGGERQITALHVPGDFVDLHGYLLKVMDHSVVAIGACTVAFVPHSSIMSVTQASSHLARMFWLSTIVDGAIQRTWITCLGRRSAEQHLAHLICELSVRLQIAGVISDWSFDFPITQAQLGDALGLSVVHVNRKIKELRESGVVVWQQTRITIRDFDRLAQMAEFDPTYLSLESEPR